MRRVIVASTYQQASLVARVLGLRSRQWRYASRVSDLEGVNAEAIVVARPTLEHDWKYADALDMALYLGRRQGVTLEEVWT